MIVRYNPTKHQAEQAIGPERGTDKALNTNHCPFNSSPKKEAAAQKLSQLAALELFYRAMLSYFLISVTFTGTHLSCYLEIKCANCCCINTVGREGGDTELWIIMSIQDKY